MTGRRWLISGLEVLGWELHRPVLRRAFRGEDSRLGRDEETGDLRGAEKMIYQILDSTFPRPFTRMSTTARLK